MSTFVSCRLWASGLQVLSRASNKSLLKWLTPGIGVKRWIGLFIAGVTLLGLGIAFLLVDLYRGQPLPPFFYVLTLRGLPGLVRGGIVGGVGIAAIVVAVVQLNRSLLAPFAQPGQTVVEAVVTHRRRSRGPKIVAVGGGTGLPTLLRGLKAYTANLTAVITVADDGGSSGRLRRDLGVLPPGDFRNNIAALANDEALMTQLFQYRFGQGGLEGHSFGNLFITALGGITGSFEQALVESSRVLAVQGQVLPSTLEQVTLMAEMREEESGTLSRVAGESVIPETAGTIGRVYLQPDRARAYPDAVRALLAADLIVLGPGSLFTSILPNLLVPGIVEAVRASAARKVYVCNIASQRGETEGFNAQDHVRAIEQHVGPGLFQTVLVNNRFPTLPDDADFEFVSIDGEGAPGMNGNLSIYRTDLIDNKRLWRHDTNKLAAALMTVLDETHASAQAY